MAGWLAGWLAGVLSYSSSLCLSCGVENRPGGKRDQRWRGSVSQGVFGSTSGFCMDSRKAFGCVAVQCLPAWFLGVERRGQFLPLQSVKIFNILKTNTASQLARCPHHDHVRILPSCCYLKLSLHSQSIFSASRDSSFLHTSQWIGDLPRRASPTPPLSHG